MKFSLELILNMKCWDRLVILPHLFNQGPKSFIVTSLYYQINVNNVADALCLMLY